MASKWTAVIVVMFLSVVAGLLHGQTPAVVVDQPYAGDRNVTGQGVAGSAPLTGYEVSGTSRNYLGKSNSVDEQGYYAIAVNPVLINGWRIVVVDSQGRSSNIATVITKSGPAGPSIEKPLRNSSVRRILLPLTIVIAQIAALSAEKAATPPKSQIGREVAIPKHLADDEEFQIPLSDLIAFGKKLFNANWTEQEGGGRPLTKGTGKPLSDLNSPLVGSRSFNRISAPDANSCAGCHNAPYGISGGGGDFVTNVFVLGQRFDFITFDSNDKIRTRGALNEQMQPVTINNVANLRATTGLFGAGYLDMLARQITHDLQVIRDSLKIRPWHQSSNVVSLREFTNTAYNQHHGIQTTERFGIDTDLDGDGVVNEMTRADVTAVSVYQATLQVPGRVIPNDPAVERAVLLGEKVFGKIGCAGCHVPSLPLDQQGWIFTEPNPYNPPGNLRSGETQTLRVDLTSDVLPQPRLKPDSRGIIHVPAFTDFRVHDICEPDDPGAESLDQNQTTWSPKFREGNRKFLTKRLWGAANEPPFFHHGLFTTLRQSVLAHAGEALASREAFQTASEDQQNALIEFLKSLQVLPPGTKDLIVDENYRPKRWIGAR
jgi:cytochrome c peroxidase